MPVKSAARLKIWLKPLLFVGFVAWVWLSSVGLASAHAGYDHSQPAANASLESGKAPPQVQVWFSENVEPDFSEIMVLNQNGQRIDTGKTLISPTDPKSLIVGLPPGLPDGPYSVVYKNVSAEDGHIVKGSFAFLVGTGSLPANQPGSSPLDLAEGSQSGAANQNANFWSIFSRWLNYLAGAGLVGALTYSLLVWRPAVVRARSTGKMGPQLDAAGEAGLSRASLVARLGLTGLLVGWVGWVIYQAASFSNQDAGQLLGFGSGSRGLKALPDFLFGSHYGQIWLARLVLIGLTGLAWAFAGGPGQSVRLPGLPNIRRNLLPAEESEKVAARPQPLPRSNPHTAAFEQRTGLFWLTLGLAGLVLLTTSLSSHAAGIPNWAWLAVVCDWLHLLSTAVWIGGLLAMSAGLAKALPVLVAGSGDRTRLLAALLPAFSQLAIVSVMLLTVTGTVQAALHLAEVNDLFSSAYGLSLTIKIALLLPVLGLAGYNLLVVSPRLRGFVKVKKAGSTDGPGSIQAGKLGLHFRRSVLAEILLTVLILVAVAFLTSSPPPNSLVSTKVRYFQASQAGLKIDLAISPGTVGENTFEARLTDTTTGQPVSDARLVELRLSMVEMVMGEPHLPLKPTGQNNGRYSGQGAFISMVGTWQGALVIQRDGQETVSMPVTFKTK